jgi:LysR family cyn operon transcriptional activator
LHPQVHLKVRSARAEEIESGLVAGTFDMGFSLAPPEFPEINSQEIFSDQITLVCSKDHPLAKRKKLEYSDFESVPMALPSHKVASTRMIGSYFETIGITPNVVVEQDDGHALIELVKLGGFVTFLPRLAIREDSEICLMNLPEPIIPIVLAVMWTQLNPASSAFLELVTSKVKAAAARNSKNA